MSDTLTSDQGASCGTAALQGKRSSNSSHNLGKKKRDYVTLEILPGGLIAVYDG